MKHVIWYYLYDTVPVNSGRGGDDLDKVVAEVMEMRNEMRDGRRRYRTVWIASHLPGPMGYFPETPEPLYWEQINSHR